MATSANGDKMISGSPRPKLIPGTHLKVKRINAKNIGLYKPIKRGSSQKIHYIIRGEKVGNWAGGRNGPTTPLGWFGNLQSNLKPFLASEVLGKCLNQQGIPKNVMLGTKNIKITPLGQELAQTQCTVGKMATTQ